MVLEVVGSYGATVVGPWWGLRLPPMCVGVRVGGGRTGSKRGVEGLYRYVRLVEAAGGGGWSHVMAGLKASGSDIKCASLVARWLGRCLRAGE